MPFRYRVVLEPTDTGISAYVPDLPGCVATGRTVAAVGRNIAAAIELHLAGMREDGTPIPAPGTGRCCRSEPSRGRSRRAHGPLLQQPG